MPVGDAITSFPLLRIHIWLIKELCRPEDTPGGETGHIRYSYKLQLRMQQQ